MNPPSPTGPRVCFGETCAPLEFTGAGMPQTGSAEATFAADTSITTLRVYGVSEELGELVGSEWPPASPITSIMPDGDVIVITGSTAWIAGSEVDAELQFADSVVRVLKVSFT